MNFQHNNPPLPSSSNDPPLPSSSAPAYHNTHSDFKYFFPDPQHSSTCMPSMPLHSVPYPLLQSPGMPSALAPAPAPAPALALASTSVPTSAPASTADQINIQLGKIDAPKRAKPSRASPHLPAEKGKAELAAAIAANCPDPGRNVKDRFKCTVAGCGKAFLRRYNLKVHARTHTHETPYSCKVPNCGKAFKWRSSMSHHHKSHMVKKPRSLIAKRVRVRAPRNRARAQLPRMLPSSLSTTTPASTHIAIVDGPHAGEPVNATAFHVSMRRGYFNGSGSAFPMSPVSSNPDMHDEDPDASIGGRLSAMHITEQGQEMVVRHREYPVLTQPIAAARAYHPAGMAGRYNYDTNCDDQVQSGLNGVIGFGDLSYAPDRMDADQLPGEHLEGFMQGDLMPGQHN